MYPRPGYPLVPEALKPILGDRKVDTRILRRFDLPEGLRLVDLDERVWLDFPPECVDPLASQVVQVVREQFDEIRDSDQVVSIDASGEALSVRARNVLFRAGFVQVPWVTTSTLQTLVAQPGAGAVTLLEWLVAGEASARLGVVNTHDLHADERSLSPSVKRAARELMRHRWSKRILGSDPRLGSAVRALHGDAPTIYDAAERLSETPVDPTTARRVVRRLRDFCALADRCKGLTLEDEAGQIVASVVPGSQAGRQAVLLRLGLEGQPPTTLAEAGAAVDLTRERVRQLEAMLTSRVRSAPPWTPVLERAQAAIAVVLPIRGQDAEQLLLERGIAKGRFSIASLRSAATTFGVQQSFEYEDQSGLLYFPGQGIPHKLVASEAKRLTTHWGASTIDTLRAELSVHDYPSVDEKLLRLSLEAVPSFSWLDDDKQWFWIRTAGRNRLLAQVQKIMSVAGSIQIAELREGAGRFYRMEGFRPPREVLARLCQQSGLYRREGDFILEGPDLPSWQAVLGNSIERQMVEVLFEFGPAMRRDDLERIVVDERGVNRSSFFVYLGYSPIIARYAPGVYGLRGAQVTAAQVSALIPPRVQHQHLLDHGWSADGTVWIAYRISPAALLSGVLTVPSAIREIIKGSYLLSTEKDLPIGTLAVRDGRMWGVSPFYRRWGIEEGDYVAVTLDLSAHRATITAGGEELLLRYQEAE